MNQENFQPEGVTVVLLAPDLNLVRRLTLPLIATNGRTEGRLGAPHEHLPEIIEADGKLYYRKHSGAYGEARVWRGCNVGQIGLGDRGSGRDDGAGHRAAGAALPRARSGWWPLALISEAFGGFCEAIADTLTRL